MRVAIIGCGAIARTHADALLKQGEEIAFLCDVVPKRAEALAKEFGISPRITADEREILEGLPDVVHICTPHDLHAETSVRFLDAGCSVLCEKPMAISLAECRKIRAAKERAKGIYGVCFQNRFLAVNRYLLERAKEEGVASCFCHVVWERGGGYYTQSDWRGRKDREGGGVLINQAIHTLDLLLLLCGMPEGIYAHTDNFHLKGVTDTEDTAEILFRYSNGKRAAFFATTAFRGSLPVEIDLLTEAGNLYSHHGILTKNGVPVPLEETPPSGYSKSDWGAGHALLIREFYDCVRENRPFSVGVEEGERALSVLLAAYESQGREILT